MRVDLVYSAVGHRAKRGIDRAGCLPFMMPALILIGGSSRFYLWRSLTAPATSASDDLDRLLPKARTVRRTVETVGFSRTATPASSSGS